MDGWLCNRLRYCNRTDWKKPDQGGASRKYPVDIFSERASLPGSANQIRLGVPYVMAYVESEKPPVAFRWLSEGGSKGVAGS